MKTQLLTVRVKPYEDELLSSFLIRLANDNGIDLLKFCSSLRNSTSHFFQRSDINLLDFYPLNSLDFNRLAEITNIEKNLLLNCTFIKITKKFSNNNSRARNMTDLIRNKLFYCPECLHEGNYYRTIWKLEGVNGCLKHNRILFDKCMNCNEAILYREINFIGKCPHCDFLLKKSISKNAEMKEIDKNTILSWMFLLNDGLLRLENNELALKLLFLLNEFKDAIDRDLITKNINKHTSLPILLQHARGTITKQKNLHINIVLNILMERNLSLEQLLNLKVPQSFKNNLIVNKKIDSLFCTAPWCASFKTCGSLIKTGTSKKKKKNNTELKYYLFCKECGCEYALDYNDQLIERTYFISAYNKLVQVNLSNLSFKKVASILNMPIDKIKRILSYFTSRDVKISLEISVDSNKLLKFINGIREGEKIKHIRKWDIWVSYSEFLVYRYHIEVINELFKKECPREKDTRDLPNKSSKFLLGKKTVDDMFNNGEDITIKNVCNKLKVSPETIRNWGCNSYIAQVKQNQRSLRIDRMREDIKFKLEQYLINTPAEKISATGFYEYIKIGRTVLWRIDNELTRYIAYKLGTLKEEENLSL